MKRFAAKLWLGYRRIRRFGFLPKLMAPIPFLLSCFLGEHFIAALGRILGVYDLSYGFVAWVGMTLLAIVAGAAMVAPLQDLGRALRDRLPGSVKHGGGGSVAVAADGLLLELGKDTRFVSYRELSDMYAVGKGRVILKFTDGTSAGLVAGESDTLVAAVSEARRAFTGADQIRLPVLPAGLRLDGGDAYRGGPSIEEVARVAFSPAAAPEARAAAVRALADAPEPLRVKLRVAAEETANPEVHEAFVEIEDGADRAKIEAG
ncbi:MAG: hypothetical protein DRJ42_25470 [Deltaproteobacteria bacterium]|nr:MAG: hypothetical protein DRJ42_25470 [Deltaproteobacteria bacterium]